MIGSADLVSAAGRLAYQHSRGFQAVTGVKPFGSSKINEVLGLTAGGRATGNLRVKSSDSSVQTLRNDFRIVLQRGLWVGVPEMSLHVFNRGMVLHVR